MYIKPLENRQVPDPAHGDVLPVEGRNVVDDQYWQRRILDGDIEVTDDPNAIKVVEAAQATADAVVTADPKPAATSSKK